MLRTALLATAWLLATLAALSPVRADQGVTVNLGQIDVDDQLSPGGRYRLPTLTVTNSGDVPGDYEVALVHQQDDRRRPPEGWFSFEPSSFFLRPGESRNVAIAIELPTNADPGDYSGVIEARPVIATDGIAIAGAAGSRVYFSVKPAGWFDAWTLRIERWMDDNSPWSYGFLPVTVAILALLLLRRRFSIRIEQRRSDE